MAQPDPCLVIVGGPNGCGKSTFARRAARTELLLEQVAINPDEYTQKAVVESADREVTLTPDGTNIIGVERAEKAVWRAIAEGRSAAAETVLSSAKFGPVVIAARDRGYQTRLGYVALPSVDMAIARVAARVKAGGHGVPEDRIRRRWTRSHQGLKTIGALVDDVLVFSNADEEPLLVAERRGRNSPIVWYQADVLPDVSRVLGAQPRP